MRVKHNLICAQCGKPFTHTDRRQKCCTYECSVARRAGTNHYRWSNRAPRINFYGYRFVYAPDHRSAGSDGYAREHTIVAERMIGRSLTADEVVHHVNGVKHDNRPENLQVLTRSEHSSLHQANAPTWYTDEELLDALRELAEQLGRTPKNDDVDALPDFPGRKAFSNHFGTWNNALRAAGLPLNLEHRPRAKKAA